MKFRIIEVDRAYSRFMDESITSFLTQNPILSKFPRRLTRHAGPIRNVAGPSPLDQEMVAHETQYTIAEKDIKELNIEAHDTFISEVANELLKQNTSTTFKVIDEVASHVGNVIDCKGQSISHDTILDMLEKVPWNFNEDGSLDNGILAMSPEQYERLSKAPHTQQHEDRFNELLERKRAEYLASKRSRRLSR